MPLQDLDYRRLLGLVGEANAALAKYDGLLQGIVNPGVLLSPITTQEAVLSSKIEGTQATLDEVLEHEAGIQMDLFKTQDIQEIVNYRHALMLASDYLQDRPISLTIVREMHKILLDSVRGKDKEPGEFRRDQNWIGAKHCTIEQATFVPVSPLHLQSVLENWVKYIQHDDLDHLLQLAVVHAQFELIHPFKDGNGRIGRLLIPLFLYQKKKLATPMFYLSAYLEANRDAYYEALARISQVGDWDGWIAFFLRAIAVQATENAKKVQEILALYADMKQRIVSITHSQYSIQILDALFNRPIFQTTELVKRTHIPKQTLLPLIRQIRESGHLKVIQEASGSRPATLAFLELLNIAEGRKIL